MIFLLDVETAKAFSYATIAVLVGIPIVVFLVYQSGLRRRKRREGDS